MLIHPRQVIPSALLRLHLVHIWPYLERSIDALEQIQRAPAQVFGLWALRLGLNGVGSGEVESQLLGETAFGEFGFIEFGILKTTC